MIDRTTFEVYWSYYKSIENMFINTTQYVSPSKTNRKTYSDEYTKISLLCGSEIDAILKLICKMEKMKPEKRDYSMNDYAKLINESDELKKSCYTPRCMTTTKEKFLIIAPFNEIQIGVKYFDYLTKYFNENVYLAILAYNAGPGKIGKWMEDDLIKNNQVDIFVENIPYLETKNYMKKILSSYWAYVNIYSKGI